MKCFILQRPYDISPATIDYTVRQPSNSGPASRCHTCGEFVEMLHWLPPHRVDLRLLGEVSGDLAFGAPIDVLVSERFRDLYRLADLSGFERFDPVQVVKVKRRRKPILDHLPNYYRSRAIRSRAKVDDEASEIVREEDRTCLECGGGGVLSAKRIVLEEGTWSGEDVFMLGACLELFWLPIGL